ncbi:unnamed protein product [Linum trigynum]|uniref:Uncharacterized protein n=1 Tax=Linum trigynum TaxID=586398 RepID=A0AAV2FUE3_9ROSI
MGCYNSRPKKAGEDQISSLPEKIIHHQILPRLQSTRLTNRIIVLSKRWAQLWRSYLILEFDAQKDFNSKESMQRIADAVKTKLSSSSHNTHTAVRIDVDFEHCDQDIFTNFIDVLLETVAAAKTPTREIDVMWGFGAPIILIASPSTCCGRRLNRYSAAAITPKFSSCDTAALTATVKNRTEKSRVTDLAESQTRSLS